MLISFEMISFYISKLAKLIEYIISNLITIFPALFLLQFLLQTINQLIQSCLIQYSVGEAVTESFALFLSVGPSNALFLFADRYSSL